MIVSRFMAAKKLVCMLMLQGMMLLVLVGCATTAPPKAKAPPRHRKPVAARPQSKPKPVDAKAQQRYYDLGLQYYAKESYDEAEEAFQEVIDLGRNTKLGLKAQENLKKIEQIQKTLEEIETK